MTSRSSSFKLFFKLILQDYKKRIWYPILVLISMFFLMEVQLLMQLDNISRWPKNFDYSKAHYFANMFLSPDGNVLLTIATVAAAILCGLSGFSYLHNRQQLDLYHSMPIRRSMLYFSKYVAGCLYFLIPLLLHLIICLVITMTNDAFSSHAVNNALGLLVTEFLFYMLVYSTTIIAVMLTGNIIISILGAGVLLCYSLLVSALKLVLYARFFYSAMISFIEPIIAFSPMDMIIKLCDTAEKYKTHNNGFSYPCVASLLGIIFLCTVICVFLGFLLYKKRPTEVAGKAIAFPIAEPIVKTIVVIPVALLCGIFLEDVSPSSNSFGWFVFGVAFGFFVSCILIEIIFRNDMREAFCHWQQILFNGACVALIVMVFQYDATGYNTYVPTDEEVVDCAVSINGLLDIYSYSNGRRARTNDYTDAESYRMEHMAIKDNPSIMELARKAAAEGLQYAKYDYYEGIEETLEYQANEARERNYCSVSIGYHLQNGKKIYRRYNVDVTDETTKKLLEDIFNDVDYKLGSSPAFVSGWNREMYEVNCISGKNVKELKLSTEQKNLLMDAYQSEYMKLTLSDVKEQLPIGKMEFIFYGNNRECYIHEDGYMVYPQFVRTIALLQEYGFDFTDTLTMEDISEIRVYDYSSDYMDEEGDGLHVSYTEKEQLEEIMETLIPYEFCYEISVFLPTEDYDVYVAFINGDGEKEERYFRFEKDMIPQFVLDGLEQKKENSMIQ